MVDGYINTVHEFARKNALDIKTTASLFEICLDELSENCTELESEFTTGNTQRIKNILHNIRGISGNYLLNDIYEQTVIVSLKFNKGNADQAKVEMLMLCSMVRQCAIDFKVALVLVQHNPGNI